VLPSWGDRRRKSSIISLLMRFYDVQKAVALDGVDVRSGTSPSAFFARPRPPDVHLFSGTIASNIRLGSDIRWSGCAPRRGGARPRFIEPLPKGYDTEVKERGPPLRGPEAAPVLRPRPRPRPARLILDEATSSVDTETEQLIQDALRVLLRAGPRS